MSKQCQWTSHAEFGTNLYGEGEVRRGLDWIMGQMGDPEVLFQLQKFNIFVFCTRRFEPPVRNRDDVDVYPLVAEGEEKLSVSNIFILQVCLLD